MQIRPLVSELLSSKAITDSEKVAILEYLGSVESLDEDAVVNAANLAQNRSAVLSKLNDIFQRHTNTPAEEFPMTMASQPQVAAGPEVHSQGSVTDMIRSMIG